MKVLMLNGSRNAKGCTFTALSEIAKELTAAGIDSEIVHIGKDAMNGNIDAAVKDVADKLKESDGLVIGSPVYWHNICGAVRNLLDRFYGKVSPGELAGRKLAFLYQGEAPEKWMLDAGEYTISRFARLYGLYYVGMAETQKDAKALAKKL